MDFAITAVFVAVALIVIGIPVSRSLKRRGWVEGRAEVLSVTRTRISDEPSGSDWYTATARVTTREGQSLTGDADGFVGSEAKAWQGTTRKAWYDPANPGRFTLIPPLRERGVSGDDVFVYGLMALIAAVAVVVVLKVL